MATYRKLNNRWQAELCVKGVRRSATFTTKRGAQAWAAREETALREDAAGQIPNEPFRDLLQRYSREVSSKKPGGTREQR
jgi:hypothetical protein